ncbi:MAG: methyltransferase domain-containing protein [Halioglobus sp.]
MDPTQSILLERHLSTVQGAAQAGPVLDLACGKGRNGLYLVRNTIPVTFADVSAEALNSVQQQLEDPVFNSNRQLATLWPVDFETEPQQQLKKNSFAGIMVFRYLHRPLMASVKDAILPGGLIVYETFTVDQPLFGRPKNPEFLLQEGELKNYFCDWEVLHQFEGRFENYAGDNPAAIAQIVARKPL